MAVKPRNFKPAAPLARPFAQPLGDILPDLLDPVLQRRAGLTTSLIGAWDEIAGPRLAGVSRPLKTIWGREGATGRDTDAAMLVIAADPSAALRVQHETGDIIARVNAFFGQKVIDRLRVVQTAVHPHRVRPAPVVPGAGDAARARAAARDVADDGLREALERLGASVYARGRAKR